MVILFLALFATTSLPAAETSKRGGTLRLARLSDPTTLDPLRVSMAEDFCLMPFLHQTLLDVADLTNVVPSTAREWSVSPDKKIYTIRLRPGVKFSNGRDVVAADYIFTLERCLNPASGSFLITYLQGIHGAEDFGKGRTNHVAGLASPTADTLTIELDLPDPTFHYLLCSSAGVAIPAEEVVRLGAKLSLQPVGTGPYVVREWKRGARLRLARNPHYHGIEPQHLDGVEVLIGGDETTHLMMFERGELDVVKNIPFPSFRRLADNQSWHDRIEFLDRTTTLCLCLNTEVPPFTNILVRRGMNHAVNRDRWLRVAGRQASHAEGVTPKIIPGFDPSLRGYDYNPAKARQLLQESMMSLPLHSTFWHPIDDSSRFIAQGVQADLKAVGIEVELKPVASAQMWDSAGIRGRVPFFLGGYGPLCPDPLETLRECFDQHAISSDQTSNLGFYHNPEVHRLLGAAATEVDVTRRYDLCRRAERIIVDDAPWVFMGFSTSFSLRQKRLKGPLMDPSWDYRYDRVWIEE